MPKKCVLWVVGCSIWPRTSLGRKGAKKSEITSFRFSLEKGSEAFIVKSMWGSYAGRLHLLARCSHLVSVCVYGSDWRMATGLMDSSLVGVKAEVVDGNWTASKGLVLLVKKQKNKRVNKKKGEEGRWGEWCWCALLYTVCCVGESESKREWDEMRCE